jgi:hypothetical protein
MEATVKKTILILKKTILILLFAASSIPALAQQPESVQRDAIKKLGWLVGQWKGESWAEYRPGQRAYIKMTETIQSKLDGTTLVIEGLGKRKISDTQEGEVVHNALAVVSYDEKAKRYRWQAWRVPGGSFIDTELKVGDSTFEWGMQSPQGSVRFTIRQNEKGEWFEIGEHSQDGKSWTKFFEMTLRRVN